VRICTDLFGLTPACYCLCMFVLSHQEAGSTHEQRGAQRTKPQYNWHMAGGEGAIRFAGSGAHGPWGGQQARARLPTSNQREFERPRAGTGTRAALSQPEPMAELEGNRIVLNATKQGPAPQAPKFLGRASHCGFPPKEARAVCRAAVWLLRAGEEREGHLPPPPLARANSLSTTNIRPEGNCQALAELAAGCKYCKGLAAGWAEAGRGPA
jgi:hypothetical protein